MTTKFATFTEYPHIFRYSITCAIFFPRINLETHHLSQFHNLASHTYHLLWQTIITLLLLMVAQRCYRIHACHHVTPENLQLLSFLSMCCCRFATITAEADVDLFLCVDAASSINSSSGCTMSATVSTCSCVVRRMLSNSKKYHRRSLCGRVTHKDNK